MIYNYQPETDPGLSFAEAVAQLRESIPNLVVEGHPDPDREEGAWLASMRDRLAELGLEVREMAVDVPDWRDYFDRAGYMGIHSGYYRGNQMEKSLEHYLTRRLLSPGQGDTLLDIGAEGSPLAEIFERLDGCTAYRQDIMYEPGINERDIGSDMSRVPVEDGFFEYVIANCAIEHFENDADIQFVREAERLLAPGGRMLVVPLYMHHRHAALTDPKFALAGEVKFDPDAVVHCLDGWGNRHGRFYSPERLVDRLVNNAPGLEFSVIVLTNPAEVDESVYCRFMLLGEKGTEKAKSK